MSDAEDVRDELRDRFGDIPPSVDGLIEVSLCRNSASALGIYEIGQRGEVIALYCESIDASLVLDLSSMLRGRVSVTQTGKKSINVKKLNGQNSLDTLKEIFGAIEAIKASRNT
jgi:transcription-repair coupling factor (superfamily II helicase)